MSYENIKPPKAHTHHKHTTPTHPGASTPTHERASTYIDRAWSWVQVTTSRPNAADTARPTPSLHRTVSACRSEERSQVSGACANGEVERERATTEALRHTAYTREAPRHVLGPQQVFVGLRGSDPSKRGRHRAPQKVELADTHASRLASQQGVHCRHTR